MLRTWRLGARDFQPPADRVSFAARASTKASQSTPRVPSVALDGVGFSSLYQRADFLQLLGPTQH